jgi:phosphatidylglycerol:prolipoprotein diacylglycerol transferase
MDLAYASIMVLAILVGTALSRVTQRHLPLSWREKIGVGIGAFCGCMIGAKLPFVLADWDGMVSGHAWFSDGKTIMCGLVGGYLGVELAKWALDIRTKTGDSFAMPVAAAVAIGRIGCFQAGCCFGRHSALPWAVSFPLSGDTLPRHPTQLYESIFHATAAVVLFILWQGGLLRGQLIKLYIISYLGYRFFTEWIRPEPQVWWSLTVYQWAALVLLPVFALLWYYDARQFKRQSATRPSVCEEGTIAS